MITGGFWYFGGRAGGADIFLFPSDEKKGIREFSYSLK